MPDCRLQIVHMHLRTPGEKTLFCGTTPSVCDLVPRILAGADNLRFWERDHSVWRFVLHLRTIKYSNSYAFDYC